MSEFKGTKGNWNNVYHNRVEKIISGENVLIAECDVSDMYYTCVTPITAKANAKLIAASPELLESLLKSQEMLNAVAESGKFNPQFGLLDRLARNKEAIKKATE